MDDMDLYDRSDLILQNLRRDPDRPYWVCELAEILFLVCGVSYDMAADLASTKSDLIAVRAKLESLENRYSELQYRFSELKKQ